MLPTSGITTEIVRLKLDENFKDIGLLCTSNKINMWSKYKPVSYSSVSGIYPNSTGTTILSSIDYGIQYIEHIASNYKNPGGWVYNKPSGGYFSPFRLGDFRGYEHDANSPVKVNTDYVELNTMYQSSYSINAMLALGNDNYAITLNELPSYILTYYFGVVFDDGTNLYGITSNTNIGNGGGVISLDLTTLPFSSMDNVVLTGYTNLFEIPKIQNENLGLTNFIAIPTNKETKKIVKITKTLGLNSYSNDITSQSSPNFSLFFSITDYTFMPVPPAEGDYFITPGSVFFKLKLTNVTTQNIPFNINNLSLNFDKTLNRTTPITVTPKVYINNILKTGIVNIPVGDFIEIVVGHENVLGFDNNGTYYQTLSSVKKTIIPVLYYKTNNLLKSFGAIRMTGNV